MPGPPTFPGWLRALLFVAGSAGVLSCENVLGLDAVKFGCREQCSGESVCIDGECTECVPGKQRCAGDTPQVCNEAGSWEDSGSPCEGAKYCEGGQCLTECPIGDLRCHRDTPQVCDENGVWQDSGPPCPVCGGCNPITGACETGPVGTCNKPIEVSAGGYHTCALLPGGGVKCWGQNDNGQLGLGDTVSRGDGPGEMGDMLPRIDLGKGVIATAIAAGASHTCALLEGGTVKCWGKNDGGALGLGDPQPRGDQPGEMGDTLPPVDLGSSATAIAIAAGAAHTCALLLGGSVKCWGLDDDGQLGLGDTLSRGDEPGEMGDMLPPVDLGSGATAIAIAAGAYHTCALLLGGSIKCWGLDDNGQLGLGDTLSRGDEPGEMGDSLPPVDLGSGATAKGITAGLEYTCALLDGGSSKCWGGNQVGQLGLGDTLSRGDEPGEMGDMLPAVDLGSGATAVAAGAYHACALLAGGSVKCWGHNETGALGLGDKQDRGDEPGEMGDMLPPVDLGRGAAAAISAGFLHTCALLGDGSLECWGYNGYGELGLGDGDSRGDEANEMGDHLPSIDL